MTGLRARLAAGDGPAADGVDAGADLVGGRLGQRRAAAGTAQFGVDNPVRLAGPVAPRPDQAVEFLPQRAQGLAAHRRRGGSGLRGWRGERGACGGGAGGAGGGGGGGAGGAGGGGGGGGGAGGGGRGGGVCGGVCGVVRGCNLGIVA